jgi:putative ABC transport system permease protein
MTQTSRFIESLAADVRYAFRHFRRTPLSTVTLLAVLVLGIGTSVVLFTLLNSLATQPSPGIPRDRALVRIRGTSHGSPNPEQQARLLSWPEVEALSARKELFTSVAAYANETALVSYGEGAPVELTASVVYATQNYFGVLSVRPAEGTVPAGEADVTALSTAPSATISHAMWLRHFGGAPNVVGRLIRVNGTPVQVVGIAPPRFTGAEGNGAITLWMPLSAYPLVQHRSAAVFSSSDTLFLSAVGRLAPEASARNASDAARSIAERFPARADSAGIRPERSADVVPLLAGNSRVGGQADLLTSQATAGGLAFLVLLITCTNAGALAVGLAAARRREIAVRLSLGADRRRLIRQLLTESLLLAMTAGAAGLVATSTGIDFLANRFEDVQLVIDWRVTVATFLIALVAGILFGLSPALHATRASLADTMRGSSGGSGRTRPQLQRGLVVMQIAFTQPLLVGLGVVVMSLAGDVQGRAGAAAPGEIVEVELDPWGGRVDPADRESRVAAAVARVAATPGVRIAMPMQTGTVGAPVVVQEPDRIAGVTTDEVLQAELTAAPRGYFNAFGAPIVRGRDFNTTEYSQAHHDAMRAPSFDAVIIDRGLARRLWGGADPVGRRFRLAVSVPANSPPMTVVGVVDKPGPAEANNRVRLYVPYAALNNGVIARTNGPGLPLVNALRKAVASEAPLMPVVRAQTMEQREAAEQRNLVRSSGGAAAGGILVLILSAIGLYAVVSFAVASRTREIGIRSALGAPRGQIVRMFFLRGLGLGVLGLALGLPLSIVAARSFAGVLHWPVPDMTLLGTGIGAVVLGVACVAAWLPARRASGVDPVLALRSE